MLREGVALALAVSAPVRDVLAHYRRSSPPPEFRSGRSHAAAGKDPGAQSYRRAVEIAAAARGDLGM